jgi:hypothetical protein
MHINLFQLVRRQSNPKEMAFQRVTQVSAETGLKPTPEGSIGTIYRKILPHLEKIQFYS